MTDHKEREVFRLAAVLYAENNYEVSPKTIHRKIIESVFLDNSNKEISIHEIIDVIEENYNFIFDYEEVNDIIKDEEFFLTNRISSTDIMVCLTTSRATTLKIKLNQNNIDFFIQEFLISHKELIASLDGKSIIYKFLYEVFSNNISSFSKLIDYKKDIEGSINIDGSFNMVEKEIVNAFLQWDNDGKNKAIFDISSYALEYCLITNNSTNNSFHLKNLKNKDFYLDTNVLFRAIGINGENRKSRTLTFLKKFNEAGESLIISQFTEAEYRSTIKYYIDQIHKKASKVNSRLFVQYKKDSDFFDYYHRWRINRTNDSSQYFEAHLMAEYEQLKKDFKIKEDYKIPFDLNKEEINKKINELSTDIFSFKNSENPYYGRFETAVTDAKNIFLLTQRRNGQYRNIFETKYFFVSSDQGLRRWDYKTNSSTPIVLLPSQWMSILLRYVKRTNDDFKSFVSFLNLSQNETNINNQKLQLILFGISEITQDFTKQSAIIEIMVEQKFKGILENNISEDEIVERAKTFAKSKLEKDLEDLAEKHNQLADVLDAHMKGSQSLIYDLDILKQIEAVKSKDLELANRSLKNELRQHYINRCLFKWKLWAYFAIPIVVFLSLYYLLLFYHKSWSYNYATRLANWVNTLPSESIQKQCATSLYFAPGAIIIPLLLLIFTRLFNQVKIQEKKDEIEKGLPGKYI